MPEVTVTKAEAILQRLEAMGSVENVENKKSRFGIEAENAVGVNLTELNLLAKEIGLNSQLAMDLFETGVYEARVLCSKIYDPDELTDTLMEYWASTFENWEICDSFCTNLYARSVLSRAKAIEWSRREEVFVKRAAFAMMAGYGFAHKDAPNEVFEEFLQCAQSSAGDERHYVKKAVSWALRSVGKRNQHLNQKAIAIARKLKMHKSAAARWIARDCLRELTNPKLKLLNYPREIYGTD